MAKDSTAHRTANAATWLIGGRLVCRLIDLATFLILARVLGPTEFGVVAVAMTPIFIVEMVTDLPVYNGLIRTPTLNTATLDTAFTLSLLRSVALAVILGALAVPFAWFSADMRVVPLICVLAFGSALRGLASPAMVIYIRQLDFLRDLAVDVSGRAVTFASATAFALATESYWAIAVGTVTGPIVTTTLSYVVAPYRPRLRLSEWHVFANLVGWHSLTQFLTAVSWQCDRVLLSRYVPVDAFGRYAVADNLAVMPHNIVTLPLLRTWLPGFTLVQADSERLREAYRKASAATVMIVAPAYVGLAVMADPAIRLILGEKWLGAVPVLAWLALGSVLHLPTGPLQAIALTLNRSQFVSLQVGIDLAIKLPVMIVAVLNYGMMGAVAARVGVSVLVMFSGMLVLRAMIGLPIGRQLLAVLRPLSAAAAMGLCLMPAATWLASLPVGLTLMAGSFLTVMAGVGLYAAFILGLWLAVGQPAGPEAMALRRIQGIVQSLGRARRRLLAGDRTL